MIIVNAQAVEWWKKGLCPDCGGDLDKTCGFCGNCQKEYGDHDIIKSFIEYREGEIKNSQFFFPN